MAKFIALLRGVNVGGKNKIAMPALKSVFEERGFANVLTYINSGNIIFDSALGETGAKDEACAGIGEAKPEYERIVCHGKLIFWSAALSTFSRTRWAKITQNKEAYNAITIRNANTTLKLLELVGGME